MRPGLGPITVGSEHASLTSRLAPPPRELPEVIGLIQHSGTTATTVHCGASRPPATAGCCTLLCDRSTVAFTSAKASPAGAMNATCAVAMVTATVTVWGVAIAPARAAGPAPRVIAQAGIATTKTLVVCVLVAAAEMVVAAAFAANAAHAVAALPVEAATDSSHPEPAAA